MLQHVVGRIHRTLQQFRLFRNEGGVLPLGIARQEDPATAFGVRGQAVLRQRLPHLHGRPGMGQPGNHAHEHRQPDFLRQAERIGHHVVALLLVGRLEDRDQGELPVETGVLLILGGMHGRIVRRNHDKTALHTGDTGVHEGIGTYVHAHMLHAHKRPLTRIGHAQGRFHGRFLIRAPTAPHPALPRQGVTLNILRNFGGRRSGIGVHAGESGMQGAQGNRLVTEQQSFTFHASNTI